MFQILSMIILFIGLTYGFGLLYMFIDKYLDRYVNWNFGWKGICIFGVIGVPFHEFTHYLMCKIFFHKVTDVSLFRPIKGKKDGILGYVKHKYSKNIWKMMGNFFIGIAPMFMGIGTIMLIFYFLYPEAFDLLHPIGLNLLGLKDMLINSVAFLFFIIKSINIFSWKTWIFLFFFIAIATHINMSIQDIKSSFSGLLSFVLLSWFISFYIGQLFNLTTLATAGALFIFNIYYTYFLLIGALINTLITIILKTLYKIRKTPRKR